MKIATLLQKKGGTVITVKPSATIAQTVEQLHHHRIGCIVISRDGKHLDGLVSVRDIAYAMAERNLKLRNFLFSEILDAPVERIMTHEVRTCTPEQTLRQVMAEMTRNHILHVPVVENGELRGIVSNEDVVKYAVEEMDLEKSILQDSVVRLQTMQELE
jgi:CBS domain-containing protein